MKGSIMEIRNEDRLWHNIWLTSAMLFLMQACCNGFNPVHCLRSPWHALALVLTLAGAIALAIRVLRFGRLLCDLSIKPWQIGGIIFLPALSVRCWA